jgi:DNA replication and repair protein RecF
MHLKRLSVLNFKNYPEARIEFSPTFNCFTGNNGEGKTNLLDAIHYLSFCKSFFNSIDSQNIMHDSPFFMIEGEFKLNDNDELVYCGLKRNEKKQFKRNKKEYQKLSDHIGMFPVVMVSPADASLINDGSDERRKFLDTVISQFDKTYLDSLIQYNRALQHRNVLLKRFAEMRIFDAESLEIWNDPLVRYGKIIHEKRSKFINEFIPVFDEFYKFISASKEQVNLSYESQLNSGDYDLILKDGLARDRSALYTTTGIHKDDLVFKIGDMPLKKFASQGQQKSYLVALRLAQFAFISRVMNRKPLLMLDDIYDKLDKHRVTKLLQLVSGDDFGQVFITDTNAERIGDTLKTIDPGSKIFNIENGQVNEIIYA